MRAGVVAAALLLSGVALSACGKSSSSSATTQSVPAKVDVTIIAKDIKFDQKQYSAPSGNVVFKYVNQGSLVHTLVVENPSGQRISGFRLLVTPGTTKYGSLHLSPGEYKVICDVPGHMQAGMIASLTVT
jgi:uncharacterized cupredoxin-like copper-binding protein